MWPPSPPLQFGQEKNIPAHSVERRAYWFALKTARVFPILTSRNRTMNIFIILTIITITLPPHVRDSLENKSMLFHSKKANFLPSVWPKTKYTWALILKESLLICFQSYQGISYSHTGRVDRNMNTLLSKR